MQVYLDTLSGGLVPMEQVQFTGAYTGIPGYIIISLYLSILHTRLHTVQYTLHI